MWIREIVYQLRQTEVSLAEESLSFAVYTNPGARNIDFTINFLWIFGRNNKKQGRYIEW